MHIKYFKERFTYQKFSDYEIEFLKQSNYIESEYSDLALEDAMFAWDFIRNNKDAIFSLSQVLHCHYLLLCQIDYSIAGKIRNQDVWIGGCHKPFISTQLITDDLEHLLMQMNRGTIEPKEAHIQFEFIHPFLDGNGRVGRIFYNAHRKKLNLPIHIIKESEKEKYYEWF